MVFKRINYYLLIVMIVSIITSCNKASNGKQKILIAHGHNENGHINKAMLHFIDGVKKESDQFEFQIFANGQLGDERSIVELVKGGVLDIAKVSCSMIGQFAPDYNIFSVPYVFESLDHYYDVMENSPEIDKMFNSTKDKGFIGIAWYDARSRSVYLREDKIVKTPADLEGLKIRTQMNSTSVKMINHMGGSATPMSLSEVYSSLQQGVIDGAESNEVALKDDGHAEVIKSYTYTQHTYGPDIVIMNIDTWNSLSEENKILFKKSLKESTQYQKGLFGDEIEQGKQLALDNGVKFYEIDRRPFIEAVKPLHEEFKASRASNREYFDAIKARVKLIGGAKND